MRSIVTDANQREVNLEEVNLEEVNLEEKAAAAVEYLLAANIYWPLRGID
jgi:hypothetical protein